MDSSNRAKTTKHAIAVDGQGRNGAHPLPTTASALPPELSSNAKKTSSPSKAITADLGMYSILYYALLCNFPLARLGRERGRSRDHKVYARGPSSWGW